MLPERLMAMLAGFFGVLAAALATIGLYGLMSYVVARRRNEIGVRLALGASPGLVVRMVVEDAGRLLAVGLAAGLVLAVAAGRIAGSTSLLFNLTPHDPAALVAACALLTVIAAAASMIPARRAARLDALVALRHD
jgi:ABC-type antimicrobial peptide transport system permease subunit